MVPFQAVTMNGKTVRVHRKNCPYSVHEACNWHAGNIEEEHKGIPIDCLSGITPKFLKIMEDGHDPMVPCIDSDKHRFLFLGHTVLLNSRHNMIWSQTSGDL